jgi:mRNA-degrading endonuclease toxin of MazEF toxin-antitoxin module
VKRGEIWWADLGPYRAREQTGRRPVVVWQSDQLTRALQSVLVVPLTTNMARAHLAGTALIEPIDGNHPRHLLRWRFSCARFPSPAWSIGFAP